MSSWASWWAERGAEIAASHRVQLGVVAAVGIGVGVSATVGLWRARRWYEVHDLKRSIPGLDDPHDVEKINAFGGAEPVTPDGEAERREDERSAALARRARLGDYDEDLIREQLARNRVFLTDAGLARLRDAFVVVVGCGGVGSHAAAALARSGCGRLRLIDFDQVTLSSLNRHAVATLADVGTSKVSCLRKRLEQIVPWTRFDCRQQLFSEDTATHHLGPWDQDGRPPDFVIDAIDNIDSKVALLHFCHRTHLPIVSSMGAGCKSDPTRVFCADISASAEDPLSRATRRHLRLRGVVEGIPVIFSSEKPGPGKAQLLPLPDHEFARGGVNELGVLPDFRIRILPVLGTMPAVFGLCAANHVILELAGYPHEYVPGKVREKMYEGILAQLQGLEERVARACGRDSLGLRIPISVDDVGYVVEEVWRGRSCVSGLTSRLALTRWRKPEGDGWIDERTPGQRADRLRLDELVCMTKDEMLRHEREVLKGDKRVEDVYDAEVLALVEKRWEEERLFRKQR